MLAGKMIIEKWGFEGKKRWGRPGILNKAAKIVLKKARYRIGDSTRKLSHNWQAKSRKGHEKRMFKVRGPWNDKEKPLFSLTSNAQLVSNL